MDAEIAQLAARQHGNVTRAQLLDLGLADGGIGHRVRVGRLHRLYTGVYAVGRPAQTALERAAAAVLACGPQAALSHRSAAALWGFLKPWPTVFDVTVLGDRRPRGIRVHRAATLAKTDLRRHQGIRVTSPARTLLDCAPLLTDRALARAVNDARLQGDLKLHHLAELLERRRGPRLARFLEDPAAPTRSEFEDALLTFCARHGLPQPKVNARVAGYEVDALFELGRVIVELDGYRFHSSREMFERDRNRDADTLAAGYSTVRVTWSRLLGAAAAEAARLAAILEPRKS